jgi:hypothetical protein
MLSDYKVDYKREETIRDLAAACLGADGSVRGYNFNITRFIETTLVGYCRKRGKELRILSG